jgi:hypothetical protein
MNKLFYICWDWSNRLLIISSWHIIILITSRDYNHVTWFCRNSAFVLLLVTFLQKTWVANDFSSSQFFQKRSKISNCIFWIFFSKKKISFLFISCMQKWHSSVIENYIKKDDVIRCEHNCLIFTEIDLLSFYKSLSRNVLINFHKSLSRERLLKK